MERPRTWREVQDEVRRQVIEKTSKGLPVTKKDLQEMYRKAGGNPKSADHFGYQLRSGGGFKRVTGVDLAWRQFENRTVYFDRKNPPSDADLRKAIFGD